MRIYNGGTFTNSYSSNALASSHKLSPFLASKQTPSSSKQPSYLPVTKNRSSLPSIVKKRSIVHLEDEENAENLGNSQAPVAKNRPSTTPGLKKGLSSRTLGEPIPGGACNLVYEPDSSGRLVEHYSENELQRMAIVGRWTAGPGKKIAGFKFKRNAGRNVLIGNCSAGVLGRKNYCNGFCQFVKQAKLMNGEVTLHDVPTGFKAMPVDVYLYYDDSRPGHQTVKLLPGKSFTTENVLAVGCLPKNTPFYEHETVDLLKWLHDAEVQGYSSKC
mmetsp:Transcript_13486/g.28269  ORF Transcript_13486/g.28269 Transcript_13486/m.28269 type:complete len:273 (+) Transcript_13486:88-906(+)|eukprot:CAMPEP_0168197000 /NCGR_PEP_ID=MMETSP0139_2-20121125/20885_1 /TAXON_ID=44445 /ORGANISM="Pseudo-nitzschia australis, Strain 10249 10 AB" /LENGTH=272 /DNA_ID=CAMNT_0008121351 /DNA_START=32 /DNA_END=850 /DNA_ORIENTATION=+